MINNYLESVNKEYPIISILRKSILVIVLVAFCIERNWMAKLGDVPAYLQFVSIVGITLIIISYFLQNGVIDYFEAQYTNALDAFLIGVFICATLSTGVAAVIRTSDVTPLIKIVIFCCIAFLIRLYHVNKEVDNNNASNVIELKDLCFNKIPINMTGPLFLDEKDVDYDLLDRGSITMELNSAIINTSPNHSVVIGLAGRWGQGKTTVINNVKKDIGKKNNIIIIDDFDPWIVGSKEALLSAMYESILDKSGIRYSYKSNRRAINALAKVVCHIPEIGSAVSDVLLNSKDPYDEAKTIINKLSTHLQRSGKKFVFIIDNIERADADNIIFLLKLIGTIFNLPNIIYILSYDKDRLIDLLSNSSKIHPQYIEKIIQKEITIPEIPRETLRSIYSSSIDNYITYVGTASNKKYDFRTLKTLISQKSSELRSFKRLLNSAFVRPLFYNKALNLKELLVLESIRFYDPNLYYAIYNNKRYFISHDKDLDRDLYMLSFDKKGFNSKGEEFYNDLFQEYPEYKAVLSELFPYVKRYNDRQPLIDEYPQYSNDKKAINKDKSICSAKYFETYFSYGSSYFLEINSNVESTVASIAKVTNKDTAEAIWCNAIRAVDPENHKEWLLHFQNYLDDIPLENTLPISVAIFNNLPLIDNSREFKAISGRSRATLIVSSLIERLDSVEMQGFISGIREKYKNIRSVAELLHDLEHFNPNKAGLISHNADLLRLFLNNTCKEVIDNNIDLYDDENYFRLNIWGIYHSDSKDKLKSYIKQVYKHSNVYKIIADTISFSTGTDGKKYYVNKQFFNDFGLESLPIEQALLEKPPQNDSERLIFELYQKFVNEDNDEFGEPSILVSREIEFDL